MHLMLSLSSSKLIPLAETFFVTCPATHFGFTWAESANFFNAFKDFLALSLRTLQRRKNHGHFLSALFQRKRYPELQLSFTGTQFKISPNNIQNID